MHDFLIFFPLSRIPENFDYFVISIFRGIVREEQKSEVKMLNLTIYPLLPPQSFTRRFLANYMRNKRT